jgi:hypothetical protein
VDSSGAVDDVEASEWALAVGVTAVLSHHEREAALGSNKERHLRKQIAEDIDPVRVRLRSPD